MGDSYYSKTIAIKMEKYIHDKKNSVARKMEISFVGALHVVWLFAAPRQSLSHEEFSRQGLKWLAFYFFFRIFLSQGSNRLLMALLHNLAENFLYPQKALPNWQTGTPLCHLGSRIAC